MFGLNPIRKVDYLPEDGMLAVQEVFYTIQGEGPFTGCPAVFVRLAGCHLACTFCDTEFESGINNRMSAHEVVTAAKKADFNNVRPLVVLTGGEPMRQAAGDLCGQLLDSGFKHVQLETAGNLWDASLETWLRSGAVSLVVSPKTSHVHPMVVKYNRHWKYVVREGDADPSDGLPHIPTQKNQPTITRLFRPWDSANGRMILGDTDNIWVSPCDAHEAVQSDANLKHAVHISMRHGYRLSLQVHKIINLP